MLTLDRSWNDLFLAEAAFGLQCGSHHLGNSGAREVLRLALFSHQTTAAVGAERLVVSGLAAKFTKLACGHFQSLFFYGLPVNLLNDLPQHVAIGLDSRP